MALHIAMKRLNSEPKEDDFDRLVDILAQNGFSPVVRSAVNSVQQILGLQILPRPGGSKKGPLSRRAETGDIPKGEILVHESSASVFYIKFESGTEDSKDQDGNQVTRTRLYLEVGMIGKQSDLTLLSQICILLQKNLAATDSTTGKPEFNSVRWYSKQFQKLVADTATAQPILSEDERSVAAVLTDRMVRSTLTTVKSAGGMLAKDVSKAVGTDAEGIIKKLLDSGLLEREFVVICKKTSQQINKLKSEDVLAELDRHGVTCSCGRKLTAERIEELLTPSERGRQLIDASRWMAAPLIDSLHRYDVSDKKILLGFKEGSDEIDSFVDVDGKLLMIELKDKEFSLGHAYRFSGRIGIYKPDHALIVTTEQVAPDVKDYFERIEPKAKVWYIEGLDSLPSQLDVLISGIRNSRALQLLRESTKASELNFDVAQLVAAKLQLEASDESEIEQWRLFDQLNYSRYQGRFFS